MDRALVVALIVGVLQGVFEWLPISSEGNLAIILTWIGSSPDSAVGFALFLHLGTALSATVYYRDELREVVGLLPGWRPANATDGEYATVTFLAIGTLVSGFVGVGAYLTLDRFVEELTGGAIIVAIGVLLVLTGVFQRLSASATLGDGKAPTVFDAVLVGIAQGLAVLPGISRSGSTTGVLLIRGHDGPDSFRFSFLLSIPAAVGGGLLAVLDTGLEETTLLAAVIALAAAAIVGYLTIDALMRVVHRVSFWGICVGLGLLAMVGGGLLLL